MADVKNNLRAVAAPQATDDTTQGYEAGSLWFNGAVLWRCSSATEDAAVWDIVPAGYRDLMHGRDEGVTHTGNTTETTLLTLTIPGKAMGPNGVLAIYWQMAMAGTAGTKTTRMKNGATSLFFAQSVAASLSGVFERRLLNANNVASQVNESNLILSPGYSSNALQASSINTDADFDLVFTGQLASAADSIRVAYYEVSVLHRW